MREFEIQPVIQNHEIETPWEYQEEAKFLYYAGGKMMERFFNGLVYPDGKKVPNPVFAFDNLRNYRTLAAYHLYPDEYGLSFRITMNTQQYDITDDKPKWRYGRIAQLETALHEMVHLWQQDGRGTDPFTQGRKETHNAEFVEKCNELGLFPKRGPGYHIAPPAKDSPFGILIRDLGIAWDIPEVAVDGRKSWFIIVDGGKHGNRSGNSTLTKWECSNCHLPVRVGIKEDPKLIHEPCNSVFIRSKSGKVYQAKH